MSYARAGSSPAFGTNIKELRTTFHELNPAKTNNFRYLITPTRN